MAADRADGRAARPRGRRRRAVEDQVLELAAAITGSTTARTWTRLEPEPGRFAAGASCAAPERAAAVAV